MKNKFLVIFITIISILIIFANNTNVSAVDNTEIYDDFTFTYKGIKYTLPKFPFADKPFLLLASNADGSVPSIEYFQVRVYEGSLNDGEICCPYIFKRGDGQWNNSFVIYTKDSDGNITIVNKCATFSVYGYSIATDSYSTGFSGNFCSFDSDTIIYSAEENCTNVFVTANPSCVYSSSVQNTNQLYNLTVEEVSSPFFRFPPQTLREIMKVEGEKKIIPITLAGLLKLLIPLLICLLGFWKAWRLLSNLLRKA